MFFSNTAIESMESKNQAARAANEAAIRNAPKPREYTSFAIGAPSTGKSLSYGSGGSESNVTTTASSASSSSSASNTNTGGFDSNGSLQNVFTNLGKIAEDKANNDQRRFREDLPFQSRIYQDFDTEAAGRTEGIDTRAREQNSNLTKDRMRLQSTQNIAEEKNRGQVQVNTTGQTRDADLKRALSVLPRK